MALTIDSKIKELMANEKARIEVDVIAPGLTTHPAIGLAKNMTLRKCATLLPDRLTPEVMARIAEILKQVGGEAEPEEAKKPVVSKKQSWDFDEIVDRENTNSVKYQTGVMLNPYLPDEHIPMWIADMDFACPQPILDAMKVRLDKRILGYSMPLDPNYYVAVIDWMKRRHNLVIDFDSIIFSSGVITAMEVAVMRLTKPDEGVIMNTPGYHPFDDSIKKYGRRPVYSPLINTDGYYTFDYEDLEEKARDPKNTLFFFCSPHNPSGRVWREEELIRVAEICFENNVFVFSDEIHADLIRCNQKHIPLQTLYPHEKRMMTATAPSKTFNIAGNHLSNILIPDRELAAQWRLKMYCGQPNPLSVDACIAAYNECEDWLESLRAYLDDNFRYVDETLKKHLPKAKFCIPEGTYLCWIDMRGLGMSDEELKKTVSRAGLYIEYADEFVADGKGFVRINIACPRTTLKRAMKLFCTSLGGTFNENDLEVDDTTQEGKRLTVGNTMPDFCYNTIERTGVSFKNAMGGKRTALIFLRYYGCTVCRLYIQKLAQNYAEIEECSAQLKVVLQSDPTLLKKDIEGLQPFEFICDPKGSLYKKFDIGDAKNKLSLVGGVPGLKELYAAKKAGFFHGRYEGNELQLPACFVVEPNMKISFTHYARSFADMPSANEVAKLLGQ